MKRSILVLGLTSLALVLSGCSGKGKSASAKDDGKAVAGSTKINPWSRDDAIAAEKAAEEAKSKKKAKSAPAPTSSDKPKLNAWSSDEAIAAAEAEKEAKSKKKKK